MVAPGHFKLHAAYTPDLTAGDYVLEGTQTLSSGSDTYATEQLQTHLKVTAPRFTLPADQIASTFPPANSEGAYEDRLPQIVIKRRTLPWERKPEPDSPETEPWLALVVVAEGEGTLSTETKVAECVTPGITLTGDGDVATSVYLSVPQSVLDKIFPTREDLSLLAHVREVDLRDTELAMGDDDGFLSVVLANRLPQFNRETCTPVRYLACLVSLEGQAHLLPPPPPEPHFDFDSNVQVVNTTLITAIKPDPDHAVTGKPGVEPRFANERSAQPLGGAKASVASWAVNRAHVEGVALSTTQSKVSSEVRTAMGIGFKRNLELVIAEAFYRFPVLAHWSFTCNGAGSFGSYMQGLDVGLLGTAPPDPKGRKLPPCTEPPGGDKPPGSPPTRLPPELVETGHVGLPYVTRGGDAQRAWYRGALTPHVIDRDQPDGTGHLRFAHVSDQLRRVVPDGREDLAYAAAFEIGRLLALSQPAVIDALMRWRRDRFSVERAARLTDQVRAGMLGLLPNVEWLRQPGLGDQVAKQFVKVAGVNPAQVLGPSRPLVDPARPLDLMGRSLDDVLARGLSIPSTAVAILRGSEGHPGVDSVGLGVLNGIRQSQVDLAHAADAPFDAGALAHLGASLTDVVEGFVRDTQVPARVGAGSFDPGARFRGGNR